MSTLPPPSPPVVGGTPKRHSGEGNHPITRVVIHSAVIPCEVGRAKQLAEWNRTGATGGSWHYAVDPAETIQCSYDRFTCHHAPPNSHSIGIEMCDWPAGVPVKSLRAKARRTWRWRTFAHKKMLTRTARLTAELCLAYDLPIRFVGPAGLRKGRKGITTHASVSAAFGQSSHWDPGFWPRRRFMRLVRGHVADLRADGW